MARMVFAFEFQDGFDAALYISRHLIEWAADPSGEQLAQVVQLRDLVPDPSQPPDLD